MKKSILTAGLLMLATVSFGQELKRFYNTRSYLYGYTDPAKGVMGELKPVIKAQYVEAEENGFKDGGNIAIVRTRPKGAACCDKDLTGIIDKTGTEIIPIGSVKAAFRHKNSNFIMIRKEADDKRGLMFKDGRTIFPLEYKVMSLIGCDWLADSKPTMLMFGKDGKYGLMQLATEKMTPMHFESILTHDYWESYAVKLNGKWAFINFNFEEITPYKYTDMGWSNDNDSFWCELGGTRKLINAFTGKEGSIYTGEKPKDYSSPSGGNSSNSSSGSSSNKTAKVYKFECRDCKKTATGNTNSSTSTGLYNEKCPVKTAQNQSHSWESKGEVK